MCHHIYLHILAKTQYWKVFCLCFCLCLCICLCQHWKCLESHVSPHLSAHPGEDTILKSSCILRSSQHPPPSESKSHCSRFCRNLSGAWATLSSEFNMSASSSNMSTSLRTSETFLVWVVGSRLREFLHCANSYPGIETRIHCIGSHLYILYTAPI